jgi:prepilin-type N-terminal cleavage/methylation domain-containing protein
VKALRRGARAFTLIETMIVVAIVATLATIAVPGYAGYVQRSRILEAAARLSDAAARMQERFQDERTFVDASGACAVTPPASGTSDAFALTCTATGSTFVYTATGRADKGMDAFTYAIDDTGARTTISVPSGWARSADCWTMRADGSCA